MKYYKHIDGLRAVAVLSVVFFHLDINLVKSGFLGVDIFFVISGFLITSIIIRDLENKSFSLKNFYLRRMRRILPALITVLIFSTIFAWLILLPQDLKDYSKSLVSALGSFSNLYFFKTLSFGYFSTDATVIPLLHTWSLGIEEQFYIFWPLFLIFAFNVYIGIGWKDKQALSNFDKYLIISLILVVLSLFCFRYFSYFEIYDYFNHERFYYFPLTRAFELLFGCVLAIYLTKYKPTNNKLILELLSIISILLMLYPILFKDVSYPSNWTVIACVGAVLYIYAGCNEKYNTLVNRFLSIKPIVFIGLISYSLYLWHWPIIAYLNYLSIEKTHLVKLIILIISIVLATLTYLFVEKPFRYKFKVSFKKTLIILWIIPIAIACCFALGSKYINNFGFNKSVGDYVAVGKNGNGVYEYQYPGWQERLKKLYNINDIWDYDSKDLNEKKLVQQIGNDKVYDVVIFGDSHSKVAKSMINNWTKDLGYSSILIGGDQGAIYKIIADKSYKDIVETIIHKTHPKIFILVGWWNAYGENGGPKYGNTIYFLNDIMNILEKNNIQPVILLDWPSLKGMKPTCGMTKLQQLLGMECSRPLSDVIRSQSSAVEYIDKLKEKYNNLIIVDPKKVICSHNKCPNVMNNHIIYMDSNKMIDNNDLNNAHLNEYGSNLIGELYLKKYGNPLKSS
ncbi:acyltransferase family protein [Francisella philomiragia]|uniref:acyltransferase family protein n=1 Tax=Francisella philomiragia TaxID=28110 RepID=UPI003515FE00